MLARKLGPGARAAALAARLRDWVIVHSAHVSPYGAVPATLIEQPGAIADVHLLLVEDRAALDATEPNYDRVTLTGIELDVDRLGRIDAAEAYISKWGPLLSAGAPVPLGALPQDELLTALRGAA